MSIVLERNNNWMANPLFNELKRQASFFLKEKMKTARLALTDVTPAQLLTEEATNGDLWVADTRSMALISRAAFEVDDYWRIVEILHKRFTKFDRRTWRVSYKSLVLLEHLLTHGPLRVADEFHTDKHVIKEMGAFQFVDDKGFNWGLSVKKLSERILKLIESEVFLKEERAKARKLTRGIQGFGSFSGHHRSDDGNLFSDSKFRKCSRSNSDYINHDYEFLASDAKDDGRIGEEDYTALEDHPFCHTDNNHIKAALLSF